MARVFRVNKSRKEHTCGHGGHAIPVGDPYTYAAPGFRGRKIIRCQEHPFRQSDLTTSERATALAGIEAFEDALDVIDASSEHALEEIETALDELKSVFEEYLQTREQALEAWENGNSQLEELRDRAEEAASEIEALEVDIIDFEEDEDGSEDGLNSWIEHVEAQIEELRDTVGGVDA